jgi:hypothetical protein
MNTITGVAVLLFATSACLFFAGCRHDIKMKQAQKKADLLWIQIADGTATKEFPEKYFPEAQRNFILNDLKNRCDIRSAKGKLAGRRYFRDFKKSIETASLAYEFPLRCDTVRFIVSYKLQEPIELYEFRIDQVEDSNILADRFGGL